MVIMATDNSSPLCVLCCHPTAIVGEDAVLAGDLPADNTATLLERFYSTIVSFGNEDKHKKVDDDKTLSAEANKSAFILKNSSCLSLCSTCQKNVGEALEGGRKVEEAEFLLISLQKQVLKALQDLQLVLGDYYQQLGRIEGVVNSSNESHAMTSRLEQEEEEGVKSTMFQLRDGILNVTSSLRRHLDSISSKKLICNAAEKCVGNFTVEEVVVKVEADEMTFEDEDAIGLHFGDNDAVSFTSDAPVKIEKVEVTIPVEAAAPRRGTRERVPMKPYTCTVRPHTPALTPTQRAKNRKAERERVSKTAGDPKTKKKNKGGRTSKGKQEPAKEKKLTGPQKRKLLKMELCKKRWKKRLTCKACPNYRAHNIYTFEQHLRSHETSDKPHQCTLCPEQFTRKQYLRIHSMGHQKRFRRTCDVCSAKVNPADHLSHLKSHEPDITIFYCSNCSFVSGSRETHMAHLKERHSSKMARQNGLFPCDICSKEHSNFPALENHMREEHKEMVEWFTCGIDGCTKTFTLVAAFRKHQATHEEKEFVCRDCQSKYKRPRVFESNAKLLEHMKTVHRKGHFCDICCKLFVNQQQLESHLMKEHGAPKYKCDVCNAEYTSQTYLNIHKRLHTGDGFECSECGKVLESKTRLERHSLAHSTERKITCDQCGRGFKRQQHFKKHMWTHGVNTPVVKCNICNKSFSRPENLKIHLRTHTGERPYVCDLCGKAFTQSQVLSTHKKKLHPTSVLSPPHPVECTESCSLNQINN